MLASCHLRSPHLYFFLVFAAFVVVSLKCITPQMNKSTYENENLKQKKKITIFIVLSLNSMHIISTADRISFKSYLIFGFHFIFGSQNIWYFFSFNRLISLEKSLVSFSRRHAHVRILDCLSCVHSLFAFDVVFHCTT